MSVSVEKLCVSRRGERGVGAAMTGVLGGAEGETRGNASFAKGSSSSRSAGGGEWLGVGVAESEPVEE